MIKQDITLCGHTGSHNRGCEAIVKSTADIWAELGIDTVLATHDPVYDKKLGIEEFKRVIEYVEFRNHRFLRAFSLFLDRICKLQYLANCIRQKDVFKTINNSIALNVGGDTYCYDVLPKVSINLNKYCSKHDIPCILWACSIESDKLSNPIIRDDMDRYSLIMPRESRTYNNLLKAGIPESKVYKMADPAFTLKAEYTDLPKGFLEDNTVGINLSPLVMEWSDNSDLVFRNYCQTIQYILSSTDMHICLIPHVYMADDYDLIPHKAIYDRFKDSGRISMITDNSLGCKKLKWIISKCRFLITARTHASIAAYSSYVPTLVMGYSIKSKGIAEDLFGTYKNYVVPTSDLKIQNQLTDAFSYIIKNEKAIKEILMEKVPVMQHSVRNAALEIQRRFNDTYRK